MTIKMDLARLPAWTPDCAVPVGADAYEHPPGGAPPPDEGANVVRLLHHELRPYFARLNRHPSMANLLAGDLRAEAYIATLERLYGFYEPTDRWLAAQLWRHEAELELRLRRKSPVLTRDLRALGLGHAEILLLPLCDRLPAESDTAYALGCLYAVEGAGLGGRAIARRLQLTLETDPATGGAYFHGYGDSEQRMWQSLTASLSWLLYDTDASRRARDGAVDTVERLCAWLAKEPQRPRLPNRAAA